MRTSTLPGFQPPETPRWWPYLTLTQQQEAATIAERTAMSRETAARLVTLVHAFLRLSRSSSLDPDVPLAVQAYKEAGLPLPTPPAHTAIAAPLVISPASRAVTTPRKAGPRLTRRERKARNARSNHR